MYRRTALRLSSNDKWRHSGYVSQLYNVYVKDSKAKLARETDGIPEGKRFRHKIEFYSHLCGKVIQHLQKQAMSPLMLSPESARWNYSGLFFTVLYNIKHTHQKDLIVLLVALTKLLRDEHYGLYKLDPLRDCVESFLTCLFTCSYNVLAQVQIIADSVEPTMNKWKRFADLLRDIHMERRRSQNHQINTANDPPSSDAIFSEPMASPVSDTTLASGDKHMVDSRVQTFCVNHEICASCLASDPSETLFATIINRATKRKDFARIGFVLHWLYTVGLFHDETTRFFTMMLDKMLEVEKYDRTEPHPRDLISVLNYSLSFDIVDNLRNKLYDCISSHNRASMLQLNIQDTNSLLNCLLEMDNIDQGLVVALFANIELLINTSVSSTANASNMVQSYLTERTQNNGEDHTKWSNLFVDFNELNNLVDTFVARGSLPRFLQNHGRRSTMTAFNARAHSADIRELSDITRKLEVLSNSLDETRPYCLKLIDYMLQRNSGGTMEPHMVETTTFNHT
ncbi:right handed beta helix region family protein, putative [Babesia ovis]|uniref:Right handed beta helix region family protein, putative n=1 Tax=Babesia ovis TaxID=5869 RepID=A0A9W5WUU5_BABOV|nr:right handed beta helix region family protein, putative [Babesia ovis]